MHFRRGTTHLAPTKEPCLRDFIADAFVHLKFIGYTEAALPLLEKAGIKDNLDAGCFLLDKSTAINQFTNACSALRFWERKTQFN